MIGLIASATTGGLGQPDAALGQYQAAFSKFQDDYAMLKGTPELMNRAMDLRNIARNAGLLALNDVRDRFRTQYGNSPELLMIANGG